MIGYTKKRGKLIMKEIPYKTVDKKNVPKSFDFPLDSEGRKIEKRFIYDAVTPRSPDEIMEQTYKRLFNFAITNGVRSGYVDPDKDEMSIIPSKSIIKNPIVYLSFNEKVEQATMEFAIC